MFSRFKEIVHLETLVNVKFSYLNWKTSMFDQTMKKKVIFWNKFDYYQDSILRDWYFGQLRFSSRFREFA